MVIFNNSTKKVQKRKKTIAVADETGMININIWEIQFDLIKEQSSYIIKLAKVKVFNDEVSITTTTYTK